MQRTLRYAFPWSHAEVPAELRAIFAVYWPLALSSVLMIAGEQTIVVSGVARLANPTVGLAAYGIALSLSIVLEAPVIMMMTTSVALVHDRQSYFAVRRMAITLGLSLMAANILLYWSPLYDVAIVPLLRLPPDVAQAAHLPLRFMAPWSLAIAYRKFNQGILVSARQARAIGFGTIIRISTVTLVTLAGVVTLRPPGALLGGLALIAGIVVESAMVAWWTRGPARRTVLRVESTGAGLTWRSLLAFHSPLMGTATLRVLLQPLVSAGITRLPLAALSLATWPVAYGAGSLLGAPAAALPELAITFRRSAAERVAVTRFGAALGATLTAVLVAALLTPAAHLYLGVLLGVPFDVEALARQAIWLLTPVPLLTAAQALLRAGLAAERRTGAVQIAMALNVAVVAGTLAVGGKMQMVTGAPLAAGGLTLGLAAEAAALWRQAKAGRRNGKGC